MGWRQCGDLWLPEDYADRRLCSLFPVPVGHFGGSGEATPYHANAVHLDGTNDSLSLTGGFGGAVADNSVGLWSFWIKAADADWSSNAEIFGSTDSNFIKIQTMPGGGNRGTRLHCKTSGGTDLKGDIDLSGRMGLWNHLIYAWDMNAGTLEGYLNDAQVALGNKSVPSDGSTLDWANAGRTWEVHQAFARDLADVFVHSDDTLDITVTTNRRKFIDAGGKPVDLGANGANPTGNQPVWFHSGATSGWHTNAGYGGGFTENGALTDASSSPSD